MTDILLIYDRMEPPVEMAEAFYLKFKDIYDCDIHCVSTANIRTEDMNRCDVLIEIRPQSMFLARLARIARNSGRIAIANFDDDFLAIKNFHLRRRIQEKAIISILMNIDVLMSTNNSLLNKYKEIGDVHRWIKTDTAVTRDEMKDAPLPQKRNESNDRRKIKIVYYCNDGSVNAFEEVVGAMIPKIVSTFGDNIVWTFIGTKPGIDSCVCDENVNYISHLSLEEFKRELKTGDYSYGIAPLMDNEFSNHKYINKFIEFTLAGIPCIYSNVSPYKEFITNGVDGFLCNNEQSWIDAMKMMQDPNIRYQIAKNAQSKLIKSFSVELISERIVNAVPEMGGYCENIHKRTIKKIEMGLAKMEKVVYRCLDVLSRAYGRIRTEGFFSFFSYSIKRIVSR